MFSVHGRTVRPTIIFISVRLGLRQRAMHRGQRRRCGTRSWRAPTRSERTAHAALLNPHKRQVGRMLPRPDSSGMFDGMRGIIGALVVLATRGRGRAREACAVTGAFAVLACASTTTTTTSGPCAQRRGTYSARYTVRSGNCGEVSEQIATIDQQPTAPTPPCTGSIDYSPDNCEVTVEAVCPGRTPGVTVRTTGKARWNQDGSQGFAVEQTTITDGSGALMCSGTYDVTFSRL